MSATPVMRTDADGCGAASSPQRRGHAPQRNTPPPYDGGFYSSPVVLVANKGWRDTIDGRTFYRSYVTASCDGVLALKACGVAISDERIVKAIEWLRTHERFDCPQSICENFPEAWDEAIQFYHLAVRTEVYDVFAVKFN